MNPQADLPHDPGWAQRIGRFLARFAWRTEVAGAQHVPVEGPVVLIANHIGFPDGPLLLGTSPRPAHIFIKRQMFIGPVGWVLRRAGQIPVEDDGGRSALATGLNVLRSGGVVGIFPEGSRGRGDASTARAGAAWLAVHTGASVVPVAVLGTRRTGESIRAVPPPGRRIAIEYGEPVVVNRTPGASGREAVAAANERLRAALVALVAAAVARTGIALPTDDPLRAQQRA